MEHPDRAAHLVRACAVKLHMDISESTVFARICNEHAADHDRDNRPETHMDISESTIYARVWSYNENAPDQDRDNRFAGACAVEMHMDISEGNVYADQNHAVHLVRACIVEMHMDISQGNFYARIYSGKKLEIKERTQRTLI